MGVNEAQKYKEKAAPASGSCQGEGSMPGKGWKGNIPTGDRARGASTDEEGDVCSSLNVLSGWGWGWGEVFSWWNLRSQKSQILHKATALVYPKSQTPNHVTHGAQECPPPTTLQAPRTPFPAGYSKKTMELER